MSPNTKTPRPDQLCSDVDETAPVGAQAPTSPTTHNQPKAFNSILHCFPN
jgi:hypothetical protein